VNQPLTKRQFQILQAFERLQQDFGYSPTLNELGEDFGVNRVTVFGHIQALMEKGAMENLMPGASRGLELTELGRSMVSPTEKLTANPQGRERQELPESSLVKGQTIAERDASPRSAPLLGKIAAGGPILAEEHQQQVDIPNLLKLRDHSYLLQVSGDSMIGAHIAHGDWVVIQSDRKPEAKDIVVAILKTGPQEECTLKTFIPLGNGRIKLQPENPDYEATIVASQDLEVRGVVTGVMRSLAS
jgi:repressor LexA